MLIGLLDCVYPTTCFHCEIFHCEILLDGALPMCDACFDESARISGSYCRVCSEVFEGEFSENPVCPNCNDLEFSFLFAKSTLKNTAKNRQLVISYKYGKRHHLVRVLAKFCNEELEQNTHFTDLKAPVLMPVPLHWRRKFSRGFNQAELLCKELSRLSGVPWRMLLKRHRYTTTQTRLSRGERLKNLGGAFSVNKKIKDAGFRSIIIVDDVFTTGSTSEECAKMLKKEYPKVENIVVLTVLRG